MKLLKVDSVEEVQEKIWACVKNWKIDTEKIYINDSIGKVLAEDIKSDEDIPGFMRSTMDGYAVISSNTAAASEGIPVFLKNIGKIEMGTIPNFTLEDGECVEIFTGGMLPKGSNSVVMVEYTEKFGQDGVSIYSGVSEGQNTVLPDEDVSQGEMLFEVGHIVLPQTIGVLSSVGTVEIEVFKNIKMTIISTGDELISPKEKSSIGKVRDINTYTLKSLAEKNNFDVIDTFILEDNKKIIKNTVKNAMKNSDIVVISGGSSQGEKDYTSSIIDEISSPGVLTHGMAIKPGKPTIIGYDNSSETLLVGLPGHPVSAIYVFDILINNMIRKMTNRKEDFKILAKLDINIPSSPGKLTCIPVKLKEDEKGYIAIPIFGKSGLITTLTKADGYFTIDKYSEGLKAGEKVLVKLF